MKEATRNLE